MIFETWVIVFVEAFVFKTSWLYWLCSICNIYPMESYLSEYIFTIKNFLKNNNLFQECARKNDCKLFSEVSTQKLSFFLKQSKLVILAQGAEVAPVSWSEKQAFPLLIPEKPPTRPLTENFRTQSKGAAPLERVCPVLLHREPLSRYSVSSCLCVEAGFLLSLSMLAGRYWAIFRHYLSSDSHTLC